MFRLTATAPGSRARAGVLTTLHGEIATPVFMPVGTRGTVRTQTAKQLDALGAPILLANTYHLLLRPGARALEQLGGLHRFIGWSGSILTDSGGFQVFSLGASTTEDGAQLRNPTSGTTILMTPESSIAMQRSIGSDIMMVFDQCIDATSPLSVARAGMDRTHRWARRSLAARGDSAQALFAIVQGACFEELRRESAAELSSIEGFDGFAIGGLAVGESKAQREDITELTASMLPADRPRYLMGVGTPLDILEGVHRGVDMFDCIMPTAWAQNGTAFTSRGKLDLRRMVHQLAQAPLDAACACETCTTYSRSYLHHLIKSGEPLGWQLLATHNLWFYVDLMREIRAHIVAGTFSAFYAERRASLALADVDNPPGRRPRTKPSKPTTRGAFSLHEHAGQWSIRHASGESIHSDGAYIAQSQLIASGRKLVVWNVGLRAAHNAMALIRAVECSQAEVELVSFEHDLDALHLALSHLKHFPHLRHRAPHMLVEYGRYATDRLTWRLVKGDFATQFAHEPAPDVIFYDPLPTNADSPLWSLSLFRALYAHLTRPTELFTYAASTAVRTSLLDAGFHVERGAPSGQHEDMTVALKDPQVFGIRLASRLNA